MRLPRPVRIAFLLTEDEAKALRKAAEREGITVADLLRKWLRREREDEFRRDKLGKLGWK
jgi:hypothetical protein